MSLMKTPVTVGKPFVMLINFHVLFKFVKYLGTIQNRSVSISKVSATAIWCGTDGDSSNVSRDLLKKWGEWGGGSEKCKDPSTRSLIHRIDLLQIRTVNQLTALWAAEHSAKSPPRIKRTSSSGTHRVCRVFMEWVRAEATPHSLTHARTARHNHWSVQIALSKGWFGLHPSR